MPQIKSQKKRVITNEKANERNVAKRTSKREERCKAYPRKKQREEVPRRHRRRRCRARQKTSPRDHLPHRQGEE